MDKNNAWVVVLIVIIGVALISYGVYGLYKVSKYEKTTAVFDNSQLVTSRNSNGSRSTSFTWVYHFYVNGKLYHVDVNSMQLDEPKEKEITIKYDPKDPNKNIAGKDYGNYMLIIVGILFAWPVFMVKQPDDELADEETVRKSVRMAGFYVTFFINILFLILIPIVQGDIWYIVVIMLVPVLAIIRYILNLLHHKVKIKPEFEPDDPEEKLPYNEMETADSDHDSGDDGGGDDEMSGEGDIDIEG